MWVLHSRSFSLLQSGLSGHHPQPELSFRSLKRSSRKPPLTKLRYLIRLLPIGSPQEDILPLIRRIAGSIGVEVRNPKRTSYGALELDIFVPSSSDFALLLEVIAPVAMVEAYRDLNRIEPVPQGEALYSEAWVLFDAERYWECHELLEGVWRSSTGSERSFLQGVILVCAALVHHQKGEADVALGVLRRAAPQLDLGPASYHGMDVVAFRSAVRGSLESMSVAPFNLTKSAT